MDSDLKSLDLILRPSAPSPYVMQMQVPPTPGVNVPQPIKKPAPAVTMPNTRDYRSDRQYQQDRRK